MTANGIKGPGNAGSGSVTSGGAGSSGGPVMSSLVQGIDMVTMAMRSNIIPDQEYLLQGSVLDQHVEVLKHRLRGLCDNVDSGQESFQVNYLHPPHTAHCTLKQSNFTISLS